jgi:hypothetical protein
MHTIHARRILAPALVLLMVGLTGSPAGAIASYDAFVDVTVSAPGPIPNGTGISLFTGSPMTPAVVEIGAAAAFNDASASTPGVVTGSASGFAVAPPTSFAASLGGATTSGSLLNQNGAPVGFPLAIDHIALAQASTTGPDEQAFAHWSVNVLFDGVLLLSLSDSCSAGAACLHTSVASNPFTLNLTPGFHSLSITAEADGFALASEVVPEPMTLVLVGTTMAGLGLAGTMRRRG